MASTAALDAPTTHRALLPGGLVLDYIDLGRGSTTLLLHGGMGDCHAWQPQLQPLAQAHRVIAYSRRYSGGGPTAPSAGAHSLDVDVDDLSAFRRSLQLGPAHLVGTSYGALVALAYALRYPSDVLSLCLAEPPLHRWCGRTEATAKLFDQFMNDVWLPARAAFESDDAPRAVRLLTDGIWGRPTFDSLGLARQAAMMRNAASMRALTQARDPFPDLPHADVAAIAVPTLLINGEHASALHRCVVEALKRTIPGAQHCVVSGSGHGSPFENPAAFNATVLRFLADTDRGGV
jgi:pimeloyl-ACP methyl ester carboxylesterase